MLNFSAAHNEVPMSSKLIKQAVSGISIGLWQ